MADGGTSSGSDRFERLAQIVVEASALPPESRAGYLESACQGDLSLRREAEKKLAYLDAESPMLRTHGVHQHLGVTVPPDDGASPSSIHPPESIGPFRILRTLGSGGMGIVYAAEQSEPIQRQVAIKLIKVGMDSEDVIARFAMERQALAVMNHPNIARVLDAGMTETGRPYFVMELVSGTPITDYCDVQKLSIRDRLSLMLPVCQAVQHAHQKGVIHRDLKPSNVLVSLVDGAPVPKVIDFGIAKATGSQTALRAGQTVHGQVVGTPEYMSPEQAQGGEQDVDTRTDVYSLGVLLYELLTGLLPFDPSMLRDRSLGEIQRILTEVEPAKPSSRISELRTSSTPGPGSGEASGDSGVGQSRVEAGEEDVDAATVRGTDVRSLRRQLDGDLDWIVLRAIAKDPARRYESAAALGHDIERALRHEAIEARPPSTTYRLRKVIRRHRFAFAFVSTVAILLFGFGVWMSVLYGRADQNLTRALASEEEAARESRTAKEVSAFLIDLFEVSDPGQTLGNTITAREILDEGAAKIDVDLAGEPAVRAAMKGTIGEVYSKLGLFGAAEPLLENALAICMESSATDSLALAKAQFDLGVLYSTTGRFDEARELLASSVATRKRHLGEKDPLVAQAAHALAMLRWSLGEKAEAEEMLRGVIDAQGTSPGGDDADLAEYLDALAVCIATQGRADESAPYFERALEVRESQLGPDHPDVALSYSNLGMLYREQNRLEDSAEAMRKSLSIRERALGPDHIDVAASLNNLGIVEDNRGLHTEAEPHLMRAMEIRERALGSDHPLIGESLVNLAYCRSRLDRREESLELYKRALAVYEAAYGEGRPEVAWVLNDISVTLERLGRDSEALPYRERGVRLVGAIFGKDSSEVSNSLLSLARLLVRLGERSEAEPALRRALSIREAVFGGDSEEADEVLQELAVVTGSD